MKTPPVLALVLACAAFDAAAVDVGATAQAIVAGTNTFRRAQGLDALRSDDALEDAARRFARYMADTGRYGHTADGRRPTERAAAQGYDYCMIAENIAYRYRSGGYGSPRELAQAFVEDWKTSPEHRDNMLEPGASDIGVGVARDETGRYFAVQLFGRPESAAVRFDVYNRAGEGIQYQAGKRAFSLLPREVRTHVLCRPVTLTIPRPSRSDPFVAEAEDGAQYTVLDDRIVARSLSTEP